MAIAIRVIVSMATIWGKGCSRCWMRWSMRELHYQHFGAFILLECNSQKPENVGVLDCCQFCSSVPKFLSDLPWSPHAFDSHCLTQPFVFGHHSHALSVNGGLIMQFGWMHIKRLEGHIGCMRSYGFSQFILQELGHQAVYLEGKAIRTTTLARGTGG